MRNNTVFSNLLYSPAPARVKKPAWQKIFMVVVLSALSFLLSSCSSSPAPPAPKEKVSMGISKSFLSIPIYIAKAKGFFTAEGLDMTVKEFGSGKLATKAMLAGEIDVATMADMPIVFNAFKGQDFCLFSTFTSSYPFVRIIGRRDKGIRTAADLKGKKVGANRGTSSHFFLGSFLTAHHLSITDLEVIQYKTGKLPEALINNEVDAISVWQPHAEKTRLALADNAIELPSPEIYRTTFSLGAKKSFIKERRAAQEKILKALDRAAAFIQANRAEAQAIIAKIFTLDQDLVNRLWDDYTFGIYLDQALLIGLDDISRWAVENGFTDRTELPNYLDYLCPDALDTVKPQAITIIR